MHVDAGTVIHDANTGETVRQIGTVIIPQHSDEITHYSASLYKAMEARALAAEALLPKAGVETLDSAPGCRVETSYANGAGFIATYTHHGSASTPLSRVAHYLLLDAHIKEQQDAEIDAALAVLRRLVAAWDDTGNVHAVVEEARAIVEKAGGA